MAELRTSRELLESSEAAIVSALLPLPSNYIVLPHLMLPSRQWGRDPDDTDVVVISPAGILLLEYKHWQGRVEMSSGAPWRLHFVGEGAESRPNPLPILEEKVEALKSYFAQRGFGDIEIKRTVVFPERTVREGQISIPVLSTSGLAAWIEGNLNSKGDPNEARRMADELRPPSPIRMVNQYQLTSQLKKTSAKTTYLAYDTILERPVHLCQLQYDPYLASDLLDKVKNELLREAKLTLDLKHANILDVRHVIPRDDCYYVVSEWIDSCRTLKEILVKTSPLAVEVALDVGIAICHALEHAHNQGIVHRNIRPENILIAPPKTIKVADFGMAKKADVSTRSTFDLRKMAHESPYAAPEFRLGQEGHHRVDGRADLFAVGVMLYQMLTGQVPSHVDERYFEAPSKFNPNVSSALDEVIAKAIKFDPAQRFSTAAALRLRLEWLRSNTSTFQESPRYVQRRLVNRTRNSLIFAATDSKLGRQV
ncbi:MAG TPA: protein kinase, partial [Chroococcales cyanobacterium]